MGTVITGDVITQTETLRPEDEEEKKTETKEEEDSPSED